MHCVIYAVCDRQLEYRAEQLKRSVHIVRTTELSWYDSCISSCAVIGRWMGDAVLSSVQPLPYLNSVKFTMGMGLAFQDCEYNMDMFLILLMCVCRVNLIWRFIVSQSQFWWKRSLFVPHFQLVDPVTPSVFYRYCHHSNPVSLHLGCVVGYLLTSGYLLYIFERAAIDWPLDDPTWNTTGLLLPGAPSDDTPITLANSVWFQFVTAGTVGYGVFLCHTFIGRAIAVMTVVVGIAYIGLVVSAVEVRLALNREEVKVLSAMQDREYTLDIEQHAATLLQHAWVLSRQAKQAGIEGDQRRQFMEIRLEGDIQQWKTQRKEFMLFKSNSVDVDTMLEKLSMTAGRSRSKHRAVSDIVRKIQKHQDALLERQEKGEQQLVALGARLSALTTFFESLNGKA